MFKRTRKLRVALIGQGEGELPPPDRYDWYCASYATAANTRTYRYQYVVALHAHEEEQLSILNEWPFDARHVYTRATYPYYRLARAPFEYLADSACWLVALALHQPLPIKSLSLFRTPYNDHSHFLCKSGLEAHLAYALGLGIKVHLPPESTLLKSPRYPFGRSL